MIYTTGGSTLYIESTLKRSIENKGGEKTIPGSMELTGQLGDVMKESAHIAYTYAKTHLSQMDHESNVILNGQIHVHIPEVNTVVILLYGL